MDSHSDHQNTVHQLEFCTTKALASGTATKMFFSLFTKCKIPTKQWLTTLTRSCNAQTYRMGLNERQQ